MKRTFLYVLITIFAILAIAVEGCTAPYTPSSTQPKTSPSAQTDSIEVRVTDALSNQDVTSIIVTVSNAQIHLAGNSASPTTTQSSTSTTSTSTTTATTLTTDSDSGGIPLYHYLTIMYHLLISQIKLIENFYHA